MSSVKTKGRQMEDEAEMLKCQQGHLSVMGFVHRSGRMRSTGTGRSIEKGGMEEEEEECEMHKGERERHMNIAWGWLVTVWRCFEGFVILWMMCERRFGSIEQPHHKQREGRSMFAAGVFWLLREVLCTGSAMIAVDFAIGEIGKGMQKKGLMRNSLVVQLAAMRESRPKTPKKWRCPEGRMLMDCRGGDSAKRIFCSRMYLALVWLAAAVQCRYCDINATEFVAASYLAECLDNYPVEELGELVETVKKYLEGYALRDRVLALPAPYSGLSFDVVGELERIGEVQYRSGYKKHMDVGAALSRLKDPHTMYTMPCYNYYGYFSPYSFEIAYEEETGQPRAVYAVPGAMESLFEACLYRGLVEDIRDCAVVNISYDGAGYRAEEPWETIARWADENVMMSRSRAARVNAALQMYFSYRLAGLFRRPESDTIRVRYVDGEGAVRETSWMMYGMSGADIYDITRLCPLKESANGTDTQGGGSKQAAALSNWGAQHRGRGRAGAARAVVGESERRQQRKLREITRQTLMGHAFGRLNFTRSQAQQGHRGRGATNAAANVRFSEKVLLEQGSVGRRRLGTAALRDCGSTGGRAQNHLNTTQFGEGGGSALVIKERRSGGWGTGSNGKYRVTKQRLPRLRIRRGGNEHALLNISGEGREAGAGGKRRSVGEQRDGIGLVWKRGENAAGGGSEAEEEDVTVLYESEAFSAYYVESERIGVLNVDSFSPEDEKQFVASVFETLRWLREEGEKGEKGEKREGEAGKVRVVVDVRGNTGGSAGLGRGLLHVLFPGEYPLYGRERFVKSMGNMLVAEGLAGDGGVEAVEYETQKKKEKWLSEEEVREEGSGDGAVRRERVWTRVYALNREESDLFGKWAASVEWGGERLFDAEHVMVVSDGLCGGVCGQFVKHIAERHLAKVAVIGADPTDAEGDVDVGSFSGGGAVDEEEVRALAAAKYGENAEGMLPARLLREGQTVSWGMEDTLSFGVGEEAESLELKVCGADVVVLCSVTPLAMEVEERLRVAVGVGQGMERLARWEVRETAECAAGRLGRGRGSGRGGGGGEAAHQAHFTQLNSSTSSTSFSSLTAQSTSVCERYESRREAHRVLGRGVDEATGEFCETGCVSAGCESGYYENSRGLCSRIPSVKSPLCFVPESEEEAAAEQQLARNKCVGNSTNSTNSTNGTSSNEAQGAAGSGGAGDVAFVLVPIVCGACVVGVAVVFGVWWRRRGVQMERRYAKAADGGGSSLAAAPALLGAEHPGGERKEKEKEMEEMREEGATEEKQSRGEGGVDLSSPWVGSGSSRSRQGIDDGGGGGREEEEGGGGGGEEDFGEERKG
eukprot:MONOS_13753.1-p1 / transcript=MONOS_13753.1 / gene=MONOS_13753 / organism=Monocercomonoides_exilis_PA203 / gene_product=unspecified product / transcript_product=unspecified product / location=Mono_scaffold00877:5360-9887(-) / protein_length=1329 / sequence_SO=supercontig / SO=protein_coding / is_pseudo=false